METKGDTPDYRESLLEETNELANESILTPAYQRRKLLLWLFRNTITVLFAWYFWEKPWIKWVLWIGIPLALLNLLLILLGPYLLRRKIRAVRRTINRMDHESDTHSPAPPADSADLNSIN